MQCQYSSCSFKGSSYYFRTVSGKHCNLYLFATLNYFCMNHGDWNCFFQLEIIINVLVSTSRCILILMLWVYGHYEYFNSFSVRTVFIRQNMTSISIDVRFWRIKSAPLLKRFKFLSPTSSFENHERGKARVMSTSVIILSCDFVFKHIRNSPEFELWQV